MLVLCLALMMGADPGKPPRAEAFTDCNAMLFQAVVVKEAAAQAAPKAAPEPDHPAPATAEPEVALRPALVHKAR